MSVVYDLVKEELSKVQGPKQVSKNHTFVLCPYHGEKTPSLRVLHFADGRGVGSGRCYGCGRKVSWNELAQTLGLKTIGKKERRADSMEVPATNISALDDDYLSQGRKREEISFYSFDNQKAVEAAGLEDGKWRGFNFEFLEELNIRLCYVRKVLDDGEVNRYGRWYMYLPIEIRGKVHGYIKAQIHKPKEKSIPSYINSHGGWSLKSGLFPYDQAIQAMTSRGLSTIVLVEGPRDALRLIRFGIPAICILGTHSWAMRKYRLLEMTGATRIIVMMDGDKAGRKATRLIRTGRNDQDEEVCPPLSDSFNVKIVRLWLLDSEYDPGNCPKEILRTVKGLLR